MDAFRRYLEDEAGATAIEYALIVASIFLTITAMVRLFADDVNQMFNNISGNISGI